MTAHDAGAPVHGPLLTDEDEDAAIDRYVELHFSGPVSSTGFPADTDLRDDVDEPEGALLAPSPDPHQGARPGPSADASEDAMHAAYMRTHWS